MLLARTGTALLVMLATALVPVAAHADSYVRSDPSGDVVKAVFDPDGSVRQPTRADGDIVRSAVTHGPRRVTVALGFRALTRSTDETIYDVRLGTRKRVREVILIARPGKRQGSADIYDRRGNDARCRGIHWSIRYASKQLTLSVPRRCLANPRQVRVGMGVANLDRRNDLFSDDALTDGQDVDPLRWGPWVRRG